MTSPFSTKEMVHEKQMMYWPYSARLLDYLAQSAVKQHMDGDFFQQFGELGKKVPPPFSEPYTGSGVSLQ
jgi:hypothetical protein